ncbi:MAG: hypothetical protein ACT4P0_11705 [Panacagrimonas sp.]
MTIWIGADVSKAKVHSAFERSPGKWQFKVFANQAEAVLELLAYVRDKTGDAAAPLHVVRAIGCREFSKRDRSPASAITPTMSRPA